MATQGTWPLLEEDGGLKFGFVDKEQKLQGFMLTASKTTQHTALVSQLGNPLNQAQMDKNHLSI